MSPPPELISRRRRTGCVGSVPASLTVVAHRSYHTGLLAARNLRQSGEMSVSRLLALDVDGVLTDGQLYYGEQAEPLRAFHIHDGLAIQWFQRLGGTVAIITGKTSEAVSRRAAELRIAAVVQGSEDKGRDLRRIAAQLGIPIEETAMIGDDLPDLPAMRTCGFPIAVANAVAEVKAVARYVTQRSGGAGAVREAIEFMLRGAGVWARVEQHYAEMRD